MAGHGNDESFRGKSRQYIVRKGDYMGSLQAQKRDAVLEPITFVLGSDPVSRVGGASQPVTGRHGDPGCVVAFDTTQITSPDNRCNPRADDPCHPLAAAAHVPLIVPIDEVQHGVIAFSPSQGGRSMPVGDVTQTIEAGTGNKASAILAFNTKQDGADADSIAPTLLAMPHDESHPNGGGQIGGVVALDGEGNATENIAGCLSGHHSSHNRGAVCVTGEVAHSLTHEGHDASEDGTGRGTPIVANCITTREGQRYSPDAETLIVGTLDARTTGGGFPGSDGAANGHVQTMHGIPRRLTPRECERLMSWPDDHTLVPNATGKLLSDSARYKICGNGVASVHSHWIGWRIALAVEAL